MFKEMTPGKKKLLIIGAIVLVVAIIIFFVIRAKKKKKAALAAAENNYQQTPEPRPTAAPKMRVVPKEDQPRETAPEPALSVQEVVAPVERRPEPQPTKPNGAPGTLGVPGNGAGKKTATPPPAKSSLPPEFMTNANDPNAG